MAAERRPLRRSPAPEQRRQGNRDSFFNPRKSPFACAAVRRFRPRTRRRSTQAMRPTQLYGVFRPSRQTYDILLGCLWPIDVGQRRDACSSREGPEAPPTTRTAAGEGVSRPMAFRLEATTRSGREHHLALGDEAGPFGSPAWTLKRLALVRTQLGVEAKFTTDATSRVAFARRERNTPADCPTPPITLHSGPRRRRSLSSPGRDVTTRRAQYIITVTSCSRLWRSAPRGVRQGST